MLTKQPGPFPARTDGFHPERPAGCQRQRQRRAQNLPTTFAL
jgi:hypothetical protein